LAPRSPNAGKLNDRQRLAWLRLIRSENVGPATFRALVNQFGGAEAALDALPALSRRGGRAQSIRVYGKAEAEAELAAAAEAGATLVAMGEDGYPPALAHVDAPPPLLYAKGRLELAEGPIVAMVGAQNGSAVGQKLTRQLATELGLEGFVIASGLARGIDTAAHTAALERGTIAVLAGGIDIIYPPENAELQRAIGEQGLLLTERSPGRSSLPLMRAKRRSPSPISFKASGSGSSALSGRAPLILTRSSAPRDWGRARSTLSCSSSTSRDGCSVTASNSFPWSRPRTDLHSSRDLAVCASSLAIARR